MNHIWTSFIVMLLVLLQSSLAEPYTQNAGTDSTDTLGRVELPARKAFNQYARWRSSLRLCKALGDAIISNNPIYAKDELIAFITAHEKAFPHIPIDTSLLKTAIIVKNHFIFKLGISPTLTKLEECYQEFISSSPMNPPPSLIEIRPILVSSIIFTMDAVNRECETAQELQQQEYNRQLQKKNVPWPLHQIQIKTDPEACLVSSSEGDSCYMNVKEFNSYCSLFRIRQGIDLDTARILVIKKMLFDHYYSLQARIENIQPDNSLIEKEKRLLEQQRLVKETPYIIKKNVHDDTLTALYEKYHTRFFSKKLTKVFAVIGSSDSHYIDSIHRKLCNVSNKCTISEKKAYFNSLPWHEIRSDEIPDAMMEYIDTLNMLQYCYIAMPFGFYICRFVHFDRRETTSFRDAHNQLLYLYHTERAQHMEKPDSIRAFEYYQSHKERYTTPDTFLTRAWLIPDFDSTQYVLDTHKIHIKRTEDTIQFQPITLLSTRLPKHVQNVFLSRYTHASVKNNDTTITFIGPLHSMFGTWYFDIQAIIPGRKHIPFLSAYNQLLQDIQISHLPYDSILKTDAGAQANNQMVLSRAFRTYQHEQLEQSIQTIPDDTIIKMIKNNRIRCTYNKKKNPDKNKLIKQARVNLLDQMKDNERKKAVAWVSSQRINRTFLFSEVQ